MCTFDIQEMIYLFKYFYLIFFFSRLQDVIHSDSKLYLVFEFLLMDLKKYIDTVEGPIDRPLIKVRTIQVAKLSLKILFNSYTKILEFVSF